MDKVVRQYEGRGVTFMRANLDTETEVLGLSGRRARSTLIAFRGARVLGRTQWFVSDGEVGGFLERMLERGALSTAAPPFAPPAASDGSGGAPARAEQGSTGGYDGTYSFELLDSANCGSNYRSAITTIEIAGADVTGDAIGEGSLSGTRLSMARMSKAGNRQTYDASFVSPTIAQGSFTSTANRPCTGRFRLVKR